MSLVLDTTLAERCLAQICPAVFKFGLEHNLKMLVSADRRSEMIYVQAISLGGRILGFALSLTSVTNEPPRGDLMVRLGDLERSITLPQAEYDHRFGQHGYEVVAA